MNFVSQIKPNFQLNALDNLLSQSKPSSKTTLDQIKTMLTKLQLSQLIKGSSTKKATIKSKKGQVEQIIEDPNLDNKQKKEKFEGLRKLFGLSKNEFKQKYLEPLKEKYQLEKEKIESHLNDAITQMQADIDQLKKTEGPNSPQIAPLQTQLLQLQQQKDDALKLLNNKIDACKVYKSGFWGKIKGAFKKVGGFLGKVTKVIKKAIPFATKIAQIFMNPMSIFKKTD